MVCTGESRGHRLSAIGSSLPSRFFPILHNTPSIILLHHDGSGCDSPRQLVLHTVVRPLEDQVPLPPQLCFPNSSLLLLLRIEPQIKEKMQGWIGYLAYLISSHDRACMKNELASASHNASTMRNRLLDTCCVMGDLLFDDNILQAATAKHHD
jgi:hypothetical protein